MQGYDEAVVKCFLKNQEQMFPEPVADTYEEAEAMLDFLAGHGYELQYDMADGHLYRYDWNSSSDLEEREEYSLEDAALFCRDMADELLEYATDQGEETRELELFSGLFSSWCSRFINLGRENASKR